ncbi:phosphodiester glycosidase family protein [Patescibacteria group bacterium]|nr:phosphodiester glycosidase family protein [Patescibacteria group bacterium]
MFERPISRVIYPRNIKRQSGFRRILKYLKSAVFILAGFALLGGLFVKFDTPAAAEITDKYLRPIFGDRQVIFLEKIFFNFSDKATKVVYDFKKPLAPQFLNSQPNFGAPTLLNVNPIPPNPDFTALAGEGVWHNIQLNVFPNREVMAYTFVRPDFTRSFAIVSIVKMDMSQLMLGSVAGTVEPGGKVGKYGTGKVPKNIIRSNNLVAAFDGGFQYRDGAYGMIVGNTTYLPLKNDLGTIAGYNNGKIKIFNYTGQNLGNNTTFVRQNGPMLIENGNIMVTNPDSRKLWGRVIGASTYTWRSGIGITRKGNLIFAAGNNLSPQTLAQALRAAGAINAIQLDINPYWVRFNIFNSIGPGKYNSAPLNKDMKDGSKEYLSGYQKDFFYVYKK